MEVIGHGVVVDLGDGAFLRADAAGKVAPVIDGQRQIGGRGFADGLAVVPGLGQRQDVEVVFHALGDLVEDDGALRGTGVAPGFAGGVGRVERALDVLRVGARNLAEGFAGDRGDVFEILAGSGLNPLAANVVAIAWAEAHAIAELARMCCRQCRHWKILQGWSVLRSEWSRHDLDHVHQGLHGQNRGAQRFSDRASILPENALPRERLPRNRGGRIIHAGRQVGQPAFVNKVKGFAVRKGG